MMGCLILVPSPLEREILGQRGFEAQALHLCGVGPVAAAARTMHLLHLHRPRRVLLLGIAGSFDAARFPLGSPCRFSAARMDGIGIRQGDFVRPLPAVALGQQQQGGPMDFGDELTWEEGTQLLLTVPDASDSMAANRRRAAHPDALAEDMESYAVALACRFLETPLVVVRGASNLVGERDHRHWRIEDALEGVAVFARKHELGQT